MSKKHKMNEPSEANERTHKIQANHPFLWIEELFLDYRRPSDSTRVFDLLVAVAGRVDSPGPRDERWDLIRDAGSQNIENVIARKPIGKGPHFFIFPDRWLVPGEAQNFSVDLALNPDAAKFGRVYVVTHQPYIVSGCRKEQVRILRKVQ